MPYATEYSYTDIKLNEKAKTELKQRREVIDKAKQYYQGNHPKFLKVTSKVDDNVTINLAKQGVDSVVNFLMPKQPEIGVRENELLTERLDNLWKHNQDAVLMQRMIRSGALAGHVFVKMTLSDGDEYPTIGLLDPRQIIVWYDAENTSRVLWYEHRWKADNGGNQFEGDNMRQDFKPVYDGSAVVGWEILLYKKASSTWELAGEAVAWPYSIPPIIHWQHLPGSTGSYGIPELTEDILSMNDAVNKVASDVKRILRFHAFPRLVGFGFSAGNVQSTAIDGLMTVQAGPAEAKIDQLEMRSNLESSMNFLNELKTMFFRQMKVVEPPSQIDAFKGVTNFGIRATYLPMLTKNEVLRRHYGNAIAAISYIGLVMTGVSTAVIKPSDITLTWPDPLPQDMSEILQNGEKILSMGIGGRQTVAEMAGFVWETEKARMVEEFIELGDIFGNFLPRTDSNPSGQNEQR